MSYKDIVNNNGEAKINLFLKRYLEKMFLNPNFDKMKYKVVNDPKNKRLIINFKQGGK